MMLYSIIIPNRNHPELLRRALESIPFRNDVEVIVVDDASEPEQMDMEHYPGLDRPGCKVIFTSEGKGAGYARNIGMDHAHGQWLLFLDSDDFFMEGFLPLLDSHTNGDEDIVFFGCCCKDSETLQPSGRIDFRNRFLKRNFNRPELLDFHNRYLHTEPWGKMIRRDFIVRNHIRFDETVCANDYMFSVLSGHLATRISFDPAIVYCVTSRDNSLSRNYFDTPQKTRDRLDVYWRVQKLFDRNRIPLPVFYQLWTEYQQEGGQAMSIAEQFRKDNHIPKWLIWLRCRVIDIRKKFHLGVPYCE